ncbi:hypothetical protein IV203_036754 [Nitzschia inconspicua]|uniref:Uncharacterized protein n=1 Tax=Nitzschia inconspicua TaxID=303405 RepID=A0A9K3LHA9_9STRA|nr:hypothetical protein IV203_036754 [Nitzschia inconspicua]
MYVMQKNSKTNPALPSHDQGGQLPSDTTLNMAEETRMLGKSMNFAAVRGTNPGGDAANRMNNGVTVPSPFVPLSQQPQPTVPLLQQQMIHQQLSPLQQLQNLAQYHGVPIQYPLGVGPNAGGPNAGGPNAAFINPPLPLLNPSPLLQSLNYQQQQSHHDQQQQLTNPQPLLPQSHPNAVSAIAQLLQEVLQGNQAGQANQLLQQLLVQWQQLLSQQQQHQQLQNSRDVDTDKGGASVSSLNRELLPPSTSHIGASSDASHQTPAVTSSSSDNISSRHSYHRQRRERSSQEDISDYSEKRSQAQTTSSDQGSSYFKVATSSSNPPKGYHQVRLPPNKTKKTIDFLWSDVGSDLCDNEKDQDEHCDDSNQDEEEEDGILPGVMGSDGSKEQMTTGTLKIPCRARGMSLDHNPLTAFFLIPSAIQHGEEVICSHAACRKAGVKFRFCSFCETPVAKRNFGRRHSHAGEKLTRKKGGKSSDDLTACTEAAVAPSDRDNGRKRRSNQCEDRKSSRRVAKQSRLKKNKNREIPKHIGNSRSDDSCSSVETNSTSGSGDDGRRKDDQNAHGILEKFDAPRQQAWCKLLSRRPDSNDRRAMSAWVRKVLVVSDITEPLSRLDDFSVSTDEEDKKCERKEAKYSSEEEGSRS